MPAALVMSDIVSTWRCTLHLLIIIIALFLSSLPSVATSMMALSYFRFGNIGLMAFSEIASDDRLRKSRSVIIHPSSLRCGSRLVASDRIGIDVPDTFCAHFSIISSVVPREV